MTEDGEFIYKTSKDGIHLCYGFNGTGFKFLPIHGKVVLDELILQKTKKFSTKQEAKL